MKLTWLTNNLNQVGGVERVLCNLSTAFTEQNGWDVEIVSMASTESRIYFPISPKVKIRYCGIPGDEFSRAKLIRHVGKIIDSLDTDVLLTCHAYISNAAAVNRWKLKGKLVITQHTGCYAYTHTRMLVNRITYRFADRIVLLTESDAKTYYDLGVKKCVVIPNAVLNNDYGNSNLKNREIISVGRFANEKRFDLLLEAFSKVHKLFPDWKLTLVGDGALRPKIEAQIDQLELNDSVNLPGFLKDIGFAYVKSSVFALSSECEGFCLTMVEAMSYGLPVVSFDIPSSKEILEKDGGIIVPMGNVDAFAEGLRTLMASEEKREELSKKSLEYADRYSMDRILERWTALIQELGSDSRNTGKEVQS